TEYLRRNKVTEEFEVTSQVLNDFQVFLSARGIQPGISDWSKERDFISNRLKTEIFNQAFSVEKGDEVEAQRDPAIQKALEIIGSQRPVFSVRFCVQCPARIPSECCPSCLHRFAYQTSAPRPPWCGYPDNKHWISQRPSHCLQSPRN